MESTLERYESVSLSSKHIDILVGKDDDETFLDLLVKSLCEAKSKASKNLNKDLFAALDWPVDFEGYIKYLRAFAMWAPRQSDHPAWIKPGTDGHQEVYDRLCHFYWLIDQKVGPNGSIIQNIDWFAKWLVEYANLWGSFLDTTESFNDEILESFIKQSPKYQVTDCMVNGKPNNPSGWLTFNQFFARELNPGLRPIDTPFDNQIVTCPADCTFKAKYDITADSTIPNIVVKKTHQFSSIKTLLEGSQYASSFANGSFVHYFLGPYSYHRFHTPVAGEIKECYPIHGRVFLDVNVKHQQFDAPDSAQDGYEFAQARGVVIIDTTNSPYGNVGIVAVIPIGMAQVSSVNMIARVGSQALKGDEFGYFLFGGSDIIVLFQEGANAQIGTETDYRLYGSKMAAVSRLKKPVCTRSNRKTIIL
eukprot:m.29801 g.29801  ORF g.29801 m.29801 type:complete len:419 (-) comp8137_c0_seq3:182-1438(-)